MRQSRFSDRQIRVMLKQKGRGVSVTHWCREQALSQGEFSKWHAKIGNIDTSLMSWLNALEGKS